MELEYSTMTYLAIMFLWGNAFVLIVEGFTILLPSYYVSPYDGKESMLDYGSGFIMAHLVTPWLLFETVCHWWFLRDCKHNFVKKTLKNKYFKTTDTPQGWKRCCHCQLDAPPRSYHCSTCNKCILKRDHHCFFSGSCVGLHNQRNFTIFLFYLSLACGYAICMQTLYLSKEHPTYFILCVAMWRTMTGQARQISLFILCHMYICVISLLGDIFFLVWQLATIYNGQTSYEAQKQILTYKRKPYENIRAVFGPPWLWVVGLVIPFRLKADYDEISAEDKYLVVQRQS